MKGFIAIELPTKTYIKAYIISKLGEQPVMSKDHKIGQKFFDLLQHSQNKDRLDFANKMYTTTLKVYIPIDVFRHRGDNIHETNIRNFNLFVEKEIKDKFNFLMDTYIDMLPSFEAHLPTIRKRLQLDVEDWNDESIKKHYYRYRKSNKLPLFYKKSYGVNVPSDRAVNLPF